MSTLPSSAGRRRPAAAVLDDDGRSFAEVKQERIGNDADPEAVPEGAAA
jgi:hypothetical protein